MDELVVQNSDVTIQVNQPTTVKEIVVLQGPPGPQGQTGPQGPGGGAGPQGPASTVPGPQGPAGPANTLIVGTVVNGGSAAATITGAAPNQTLNLTLPAGPTGPQGPAGPPGAGSVSTVNGDPGPNVVLTAASVNAAPTSHTHAEADITGLTTDLAGKAPTVHTHAESDITGLVTDLAGKVPTTRTVSAGTGLTGGGALSANVSLAVAYGTTSTTAAVGNDSRLSDARTPTAHKATHATGGSDALVPTDIGAANRVKGGDEAVATPGTTTGTVTLDCSAASIFTVSPTGAITLTPSNVPATGHGCTITVIVAQGASVQTVALPTGGAWLGSAPTQTASKACVITMLTTNGGSTWYCSGVVQA